jgi:hypothetical protein
MTAPSLESATHIRTMHHYGFRCGQWARLVTTISLEGRDCYLVEFDDGVSDFWAVDDPAGRYEFKRA